MCNVCVILQAVKYLERMLVEANTQAEQVIEVKPQYNDTADDAASDEKATTVVVATKASVTDDDGDIEMSSIEDEKPAAAEDRVTVKQESVSPGSNAEQDKSTATALTTESKSSLDAVAANETETVDDSIAVADIKMEVDDDDCTTADGKAVDVKAGDVDDSDASAAVGRVEEADANANDIEEEMAPVAAEESRGINIDPRTYCKLGHFHLLLEDYPKGYYKGDLL